MTRPTRRERTRRMLPTEQCLARIVLLARTNVNPITRGTRQRTVGGGGGGGEEAGAEAEVGVEVEPQE